ncbi:unannotated protein [freshwater metagenome]|uniref:Unannotated protein n=1 Tax=freshwater metagenome TaxID=449393 RepID=A0A6J6C0U8_9ZZZZ
MGPLVGRISDAETWAVDLAAAAELVDLAGPVVAWPTFN